jgi:hypothetical protein
MATPDVPGYTPPPRWPVWLWRGGDVAFSVEEPPDRFAATVSNYVGPTMFAMLTGKPYAGRVREDHLVVAKNRAFFRNSWQSFLDATIEPAGTGSIVRGRFRLHRYVAAFSIVWIGIVALFVSGSLLAELEHGAAGHALFDLFLPGFFVALITVSRGLALRQEPAVVAELTQMGKAPHS